MLINTCSRPQIQAWRSSLRFLRQDVRIIEKVTEEYEKTPPEALRSTPNEFSSDKRRRMIRYVYYNPTFAQRLAILKARFFATGWIWAATALTTYIAVNALYAANRHFEKGRYCI